MARTPRWKSEGVVDGVGTYRLSSWKWFSDFINQRLLDYREYVFRGHASDRWKLETTLDRALKKIPKNRRTMARIRHLDNFKMAARGRRGRTPPTLRTDDEWWALGQHHGLHTPLLDWTEAPFVALYFAFAEIDTDGSDHRAVWALNENVAQAFNDESKNPANRGRLGDLFGKEAKIVRPLSDENARLVSQRGVFLRVPTPHTVEEVVSASFRGENQKMALLKIRIPNKERTICLRALNRMNINHLSLFPDLGGASLYSNTDLHIRDY